MRGFTRFIGFPDAPQTQESLSDRIERIIENVLLKYNSNEVEFNLDKLEGKVFDDCLDSGIGIDFETLHEACVEYLEKRAKSHKKDDGAPLIIFPRHSRPKEP